MSIRTPLLFWTAATSLLCLACGGAGPVAQTSKGVATDKPPAHRDTNKTVIAPRNAPVPEATDPNERVLYIRAGSVWIIKPDGSDAEQLSVRSSDAPDESPAVSPLGNVVAYSSARDGAHKIYVMSLEEMTPRPVTDGANGGDRNPAWSPDGERIAFVRGDPGEGRDIYLAEIAGATGAGGSPTLLVKGDDDHPEHAGMPAMSPDGASLVFSADRREGNGTALWLFDLGTKRLRRLTPTRPGGWFVRELDAAWSPDGKRVAFASNRHVASSDRADELDLYMVGHDGSGLTRLTDDPVAARHPAFSPDGKRLYFTSWRGRQNPYEMELYVMASAGGKQRRLTRDERPQNSAPSAGLTK